MNKFPMNVPVFIRSCEEEQTSNLYTKAKLKIFYVGETADHRLFTKDFSEKLLESLPNTPVVGFYSEEDEDFIGHNSTQYIYGIVPESASVSYEEEDNKTFAVTDVILYTGRKDNIGKVANKIFGKQHSLEMDPDTLKYKVNRDSQGRFMNLEFIEGQFVGLSVLGDDESPAFAGSEFFTTNQDFAKIVEQSEDKFSKFLSLLNNNGGKIEVFNSEAFFNKCVENFAKITMQEFAQKIYAALENIGVYGWVVENTDEYAVVSQWNEEERRSMYVKYSISLDNDEISLSNAQEVYVKYLTNEEINAVENPINNAEVVDDVAVAVASEDPSKDEEDKEDDEDKSQCVTTEDDEEKDDENSKCTTAEDDEDKSNDEADPQVKDEEQDDDKENCSVNDANSDDNAEGDVANATKSEESEEPEDDEKDEEDDEVGNATASVSVATLSSDEKLELEQYRRTEKLSIIAEYKGDLSDELLTTFSNEVDNYAKNDLIAALAVEFRKAVKANQTSGKVNNNVRIFGLLNTAETYNENDPADVIRKYTKK